MIQLFKLIPPKLLLFLSCFLAVIADMMFVWYAKHSDHKLSIFLVALVINFIGVLIWTYSMRIGVESAIAICVYALFTVIGCTCLGYFVFHEILSVQNIIGIILGLISLFLMTL